MLCQFLLYCKVNQLYIYIYPLFFGFPSHLDHHRALNRVPCATQQVLISYLFFLIFIYLFGCTGSYLLIYFFYIYFWLCWVFVSVRGLSPVAASGGHSSSRQLSILYIVSIVYICQSQSPNSSHPPPFPPWYPYICPLHLCLYLCSANNIIYTIFLDSTHMH